MSYLRRSHLLPVACLVQAVALAQAPAPIALAGDRQGALAVGGVQLHLVLHITGANDALAATLDSPDQGARGIPVTAVQFEGNTLTATIAAVHGGYTGTLSKDGDVLSGSWTQGQSLPLTLTRSAAGARVSVPAALERPQNPVKPYPYRSVEVSYSNPVEHDTLAGTLTIPPGNGPFPAVLLITGSGPQDRDETLLGHKPFLVLADFLTRHGIVVLRADDRGVGLSTGIFADATTADFATDARAGLALLKSRAEVDPHRIGLLGHSEGGVIAPMVAAGTTDAGKPATADPDVAFLVLLAAPGVPGAAVIADQTRSLAAASGVSPAVVAAAYTKEQRLLALVVDDTTLVGTAASSRDSTKLDAALRAELTADGVLQARLPADIAALTSPWYRYFLAYDPAPALGRVTCPVLALNGAKDMQVSPSVNLAVIRSALVIAGNTHAEVGELPGLNHLFQHAATGLPAEYGSIAETFDPAALQVIADFILEN